MGKNIKLSNRRFFMKIVLGLILLFLILTLIDDILVYKTLNGDGKIHHVVTKPINIANGLKKLP